MKITDEKLREPAAWTPTEKAKIAAELLAARAALRDARHGLDAPQPFERVRLISILDRAIDE